MMTDRASAHPVVPVTMAVNALHQLPTLGASHQAVLTPHKHCALKPRELPHLAWHCCSDMTGQGHAITCTTT